MIHHRSHRRILRNLRTGQHNNKLIIDSFDKQSIHHLLLDRIAYGYLYEIKFSFTYDLKSKKKASGNGSLSFSIECIVATVISCCFLENEMKTGTDYGLTTMGLFDIRLVVRHGDRVAISKCWYNKLYR